MPSESVVEPRSPRYNSFLVLGMVDMNSADYGPFLGRFSDMLWNYMASQDSLTPGNQAARVVD